MSTYAIGDIHGCLTALETVIEKANVSKNDTVIVLGDFIDRGPNSKEVIDFLITLANFCDLKTLRGNHEIMMLDAKQDKTELIRWLHFGGEATLDSYNASTFNDIPTAHWEFIASTLPYVETETHICVHANVNPTLPMNKQTETSLYWLPFDIQQQHISEKFIVCGHTAQQSGIPLLTPFGICIDTYAYGSGWLTCMELNTGQLFQANQAGQVAIKHIKELQITNPEY